MIPRKYSLLWRNIIWAGVIFFLCAIPSDSIPDPKLNIPHLDKVVHFGYSCAANSAIRLDCLYKKFI